MHRLSCKKFPRCVDKRCVSLVRSFLAALGMTGSWRREKENTRFLASLEICTATQNDINNFFQNNKYNPYHFFRFSENSFVLFNQKNKKPWKRNSEKITGWFSMSKTSATSPAVNTGPAGTCTRKSSGLLKNNRASTSPFRNSACIRE